MYEQLKRYVPKITIRIIQGKLFTRNSNPICIRPLVILIERSAKIIDKISTIELITLQKSINLIKELKKSNLGKRYLY